MTTYQAKLLGQYTRYVLTLGLLVAIWHHSHWSVALSITLITVALEIQLLNKE